MAESKVIVTGKARFCYLNAWEARKAEGSNKATYSVCLVIPKSDDETFNKIFEACKEIYEETRTTIFKGKTFEDVKLPLRDGDSEREGDENFASSYFINASSLYQPGVVDKDLNMILNHDDLYSGCYGRAQIAFYAYNNKGNKGIACGLRNLQKLEDGEKLGGVSGAIEAFKD